MPTPLVPELEAARKTGAKTYFTGRPCSRGHVSDRLTNYGVCIECKRAVQRRTYHAMSPEEKAAYSEEAKRKTAATPANRLIVRAKVNARKHGVPFDLKLTDVLPLPTHCPILGLRLLNNQGVENRDRSYSLDRIIPSKGYVPGNILVVSNRANQLKGDASLSELKKIAEFYSRFE